MVVMSSIGKKLRAHWLSKGLALPPGQNEARIRDFEIRNRVNLPTDFRDYFLQVDGMIPIWPNAQDPEGYAFWSLDRVKRVSEEAVEHKSGQQWSNFPGAESLFVFADYLDWSWAYAILLGTNGPGFGNVFIVGKRETPVEVASSFQDFVELYIVDSPRLYGP